jgi:hypothetical protein
LSSRSVLISCRNTVFSASNDSSERSLSSSGTSQSQATSV